MLKKMLENLKKKVGSDKKGNEMSKNKKVAPKKSAKAKPAAKKPQAKAAQSKKPVAKAPAKKVVAKPAPKKVEAKKPAAKPAPKKVEVKKHTAKAAPKKVEVKKSAAKPAPKKVEPKVAAKPAVKIEKIVAPKVDKKALKEQEKLKKKLEKERAKEEEKRAKQKAKEDKKKGKGKKSKDDDEEGFFGEEDESPRRRGEDDEDEDDDFEEEKKAAKKGKTFLDDDIAFDDDLVLEDVDFREVDIKDVRAQLGEEIISLAEHYNLDEIFRAIKGLEFYKNDSDECLEKGCDNPATTFGHCRFHYIKNWKDIKRKQAILQEGKLQTFIEELVRKYPSHFIDEILKDLSDEKSFNGVLKELDIEATDEDFEDAIEDSAVGDDQDIAFEAKVVTGKNFFDE